MRMPTHQGPGCCQDFDRAHESRRLRRRPDQQGDIADFDRAIAINPNFAEAYYHRGTAKGNKGDYDGAIADFDRAIAINPNDAEAYVNRGAIKQRKGDYDGAIADYDRAIDQPQLCRCLQQPGHCQREQRGLRRRYRRFRPRHRHQPQLCGGLLPGPPGHCQWGTKGITTG